MSMYSEYIKEHRGDEIIETEQGFASYRYLNKNQVYIVDLYVLPQFRNENVASSMADKIASIAKSKGCTKMLGTVVPSANNSADSMKILLAYGMKPSNIEGNMVVFSKDIK
jgi:GNAT superfamily N-acetyltransferase